MTYTCVLCGLAFYYMGTNMPSGYVPACCDACLRPVRSQSDADATSAEARDKQAAQSDPRGVK